MSEGLERRAGTCWLCNELGSIQIRLGERRLSGKLSERLAILHEGQQVLPLAEAAICCSVYSVDQPP